MGQLWGLSPPQQPARGVSLPKQQGQQDQPLHGFALLTGVSSSSLLSLLVSLLCRLVLQPHSPSPYVDPEPRKTALTLLEKLGHQVSGEHQTPDSNIKHVTPSVREDERLVDVQKYRHIEIQT